MFQDPEEYFHFNQDNMEPELKKHYLELLEKSDLVDKLLALNRDDYVTEITRLLDEHS